MRAHVSTRPTWSVAPLRYFAICRIDHFESSGIVEVTSRLRGQQSFGVLPSGSSAVLTLTARATHSGTASCAAPAADRAGRWEISTFRGAASSTAGKELPVTEPATPGLVPARDDESAADDDPRGALGNSKGSDRRTVALLDPRQRRSDRRVSWAPCRVARRPQVRSPKQKPPPKMAVGVVRSSWGRSP